MAKSKYLEVNCGTEAHFNIMKSLIQLYTIDSTWEETLTCKIFYREEMLSKDDLQAMIENIDPFCLSIQKKAYEEKNWNAVWESNFTPVRVGDFCEIYAEFHDCPENVTHEIQIAPKMAFGTGHHETTYMMIEQMSKMDLTNKSVVDVGMGTGILSILAAKMNAGEVIGIDHEQPAYTNAVEHAEMNGVEVNFMHGDLTDLPEKKFDVVLANINRKILLDHADMIKALVAKDGKLLLSGILRPDIALIDQAYHDLQLNGIYGKKDWTCFVYTKEY